MREFIHYYILHRRGNTLSLLYFCLSGITGFTQFFIGSGRDPARGGGAPSHHSPPLQTDESGFYLKIPFGEGARG
jgi:hypothetical protein